MQNIKTSGRLNGEEPPSEIEPEDRVSALARGVTILRCIAAAGAPITYRQLAEQTLIPRATVFRLTATLIAMGLVAPASGTERLRLGPGVLPLSAAYLRGLDVRAEARPFLAEFAETVGAAVHIGVRDRLDMVIIDAIRPDVPFTMIRIEIGARLGLASSALGRAYLAALPPAEQTSLLQTLALSLGDGWPQMRGRLAAALAEDAEQGFSLSIKDWHPDVNAVAVPFTGPDGERYAINCGAPAFILDENRLRNDVAPKLRDCVAKITAALGMS